MRIVAGSLKGRVIREPRRDLRPTSERVREALFSMLGPRVDGARVLDGFAGTGALGFEALSRGAISATFVERDAVTARCLSETAVSLGVTAQTTVARADWLRWAPAAIARGDAYDLVLLDPPYALPELADATSFGGRLVAPGGLLVVEAGERDPMPERAGDLPRVELRRYGGTTVALFGA